MPERRGTCGAIGALLALGAACAPEPLASSGSAAPVAGYPRTIVLPGASELTIPGEIAWVFRGDRGLTWSREPPDNADIVAGEWWPADHDGPPLVSLDADVGQALGIGPGDPLTFILRA